jgi:hypothetical protein
VLALLVKNKMRLKDIFRRKLNESDNDHEHHIKQLNNASSENIHDALDNIKKLPHEHVNKIAHGYIKGREKYKTKTEALKAIHSFHKEKEYQKVKMIQVAKASRF